MFSDWAKAQFKSRILSSPIMQYKNNLNLGANLVQSCHRKQLEFGASPCKCKNWPHPIPSNKTTKIWSKSNVESTASPQFCSVSQCEIHSKELAKPRIDLLVPKPLSPQSNYAIENNLNFIIIGASILHYSGLVPLAQVY